MAGALTVILALMVSSSSSVVGEVAAAGTTDFRSDGERTRTVTFVAAFGVVADDASLADNLALGKSASVNVIRRGRTI